MKQRHVYRLGLTQPRTEDAGSASHVALHATHTFSRLQGRASGIVGDAFADERHATLLAATGLVRERDQTRRSAFGTLAHLPHAAISLVSKVRPLNNVRCHLIEALRRLE